MTNFNNRYNKLIEERSSNGRVIINSDTNLKKFKLFEDIDNSHKSCNNNLNNQQSDSLLSSIFFSEDNVNIIQNAIRYKIWILTDKKNIISKQCNIQLNIVMKSIYFQYSKNLNTKIKEQIITLNDKVTDYCINNIYNNILQYESYTNDISSGLNLMDLPKTESIKGTKTFRLDKFF